MKKIIFTVLFLGLSALSVQAAQVSNSAETIRKRVKEYVTFLCKIGKYGSTAPVLKDMPPIWAKKCRKIINGTEILSEGAQLPKQLDDALKMAGKWHVKQLGLTLGKYGDTAPTMAAVTYELSSEKMGAFRTVAFLHFDKKRNITEINEICEQLA